MTTDTDIKQIVRERYASAAVAKTSCCGPKTCGDTTGPDLGLNMIGDAYRDVEGYLADADLGLGCGLPTQHAGIKAGDVVLDLGSGAGIDAFVTRRIVGATGRVIGIDMTPEMLTRARENAAKLSYDNVEFRLGEIEVLPVEDAATDVVVSNCVLNLVPNKARAFAEIFRVLRPDAHFCVSDIVATASGADQKCRRPLRRVCGWRIACERLSVPDRRRRLRRRRDCRNQAHRAPRRRTFALHRSGGDRRISADRRRLAEHYGARNETE